MHRTPGCAPSTRLPRRAGCRGDAADQRAGNAEREADPAAVDSSRRCRRRSRVKRRQSAGSKPTSSRRRFARSVQPRRARAARLRDARAAASAERGLLSTAAVKLACRLAVPQSPCRRRAVQRVQVPPAKLPRTCQDQRVGPMLPVRTTEGDDELRCGARVGLAAPGKRRRRARQVAAVGHLLDRALGEEAARTRVAKSSAELAVPLPVRVHDLRGRRQPRLVLVVGADSAVGVTDVEEAGHRLREAAGRCRADVSGRPAEHRRQAARPFGAARSPRARRRGEWRGPRSR